MKKGLLKKIGSGILTALLIVQLTGVYFFSLPTQRTEAAGIFIQIPNLATNIATTSASVVDTASTVEQSFLSKVLDFAAVTLAQTATKVLSGKITNWLSNGAKGPLFTKDDFKTLLLDVADQTLRAALTELDINKADNEFPFEEFNLDPVLVSNVEGVSTSQWITRFVEEYVTFTAIGSPIAGDSLGFSELTSFYENGVLKPEFQTGGANSGQYSPDREMWAYTIPLKNCTYIKIAVNHDDRPIAYTNSGTVNSPNPKPKPTDYLRPVENSNTKKLEFRATHVERGPGGATTEIRTNYEPFETGSWDCGGGTPFALDLARTIVNKRNVDFEDIVEVSFEKITGINLNDFIEDASLAYEEADPYFLWGLAGEPENTPIGSNLNYAAAVGRQITQQLKDKELDFTAPGFLPDVTCGKKRAITYPDGSEELICDKNQTLSPQAAVAGYAKEALTTSFKNLENTDKWQKILFTAAIQLTTSALEGGLNYVANEIRSSKNSQTVAIEGLGPYDQLDADAANNSDGQDDNAWQRIADRKVDFSQLDEQINLTLTEAEWLRRSVEEMRELPALYYVLDKYFALGPDIGWEERMKQNFGNDISRLVQKVSRESGDGNDSQSRANLLEHLQRELAREISYTKEALETIPYPGQVIIQDTLKKVESDAIFREETKNRATDKRNTATLLISIRDEILGSIGGSQNLSLLLEKPPVWPDRFIVDRYKVSLEESSLAQLVRKAREANWDNAQVQSELQFSSTELTAAVERRDASLGFGGGVTGSSRTPQTRSSVVSPDQDALDTTGTQGDVDGDSVPDDIESLLCESFGTCTAINPSNGTLVEFNAQTDTDGDGVSDYQEFLAGEHPVYESYGPIDLNGDGDTFDLVDINGDGTIDLREGDRDCNGDGDFNDTCSIAVNITDADGDGFINENEDRSDCTSASCPNYTSVSIPEKVNTYLGALEEYNRRFNGFVESLNENTSNSKAMRVILNRLVNRYLGVQNNISKESSLRQAESGYDLAKEKINNLRTLMDQAYLTWYRLDKGSELPETDANNDGLIDAIGRTGISVPGFGFIEDIPDMWCLNDDNETAGKCLGVQALPYQGTTLRRSVDGQPARVLRMLGAPVTQNGNNPRCPALRIIPDANAQTGERTICTNGGPIGPTPQSLTLLTLPTQQISSGDTLTLTFPTNINLTGLTHNDVDITLDIEDNFGFVTPTPMDLGPSAVGQTWGVTFSTRTMTMRVGTGVNPGPLLQAMKINIGTTASHQANGTNELTNTSSSATSATLSFNGANPQSINIPGVTPTGGGSGNFYTEPMASIMHRLPAPAFNWYQWRVPGTWLFYKLHQSPKVTVLENDGSGNTKEVNNPYHLQYPLDIPRNICPVDDTECYTWVDVNTDTGVVTPEFERASGVVYNLQQPYYSDQLDQLYCNFHGLLFNDLNVYMNKVTGVNEDRWYKDDGTLNTIGQKWWKNPQKCTDWYRSEYGDYLAK